MYRSELRSGVLHRSIRLPADAVADDVTADYRSGVLTVRLPIDRDRASTRRIPVRQG